MLIKTFPQKKFLGSWEHTREFYQMVQENLTLILKTRNYKIKKNLNKWTYHNNGRLNIVNMSTFPKLRQVGWLFPNTHTQIPPKTYKFRILGVKPMHVLFRGKRIHPHPSLQSQPPNHYPYVIGLRVLFSICPPSCHQPSIKQSTSLLRGLPTSNLPKWPCCPLATMWIFLRFSSEPSADKKRITHIMRPTHYGKGLGLVPEAFFLFPPSSNTPRGTQGRPVGMKSVCPCFTEHL